MMTPQTCHHGRSIEGSLLGDVVKGESSCDDCEIEEWEQVRLLTIVGTTILVMVLLTPVVLVLMGVFW